MATPDIRNKLLQQGATSVANAKPVEKNQFLPEIPKSTLNVALPTDVINSLNTVQTQSRTAINKERIRIDKTADAIKVANKEIDGATKQLNETNSSAILDIVGIFDNDYNRNFQNARIETAKRNLVRHDQEQQLQRQRDNLDLKEAGLPVELYKQQIGLQTQTAQLSTAQANAIVSSNAARANMKKILQGQTHPDEIASMHKNKTQNVLWSHQDVTNYMNNMEEFQLDMNFKRIANQTKNLKLAEKMEDRALSKVPLNWLAFQVDSAEKAKENIIKIPGTNTHITKDKAKGILAQRLKAQNEAFTSIAKTQTELVKNDAEMTQAMSNVSSVSSIYSSNGNTLTGLKDLNLLNISDDTIAEIPIENIHPKLQADFQDVLASASLMNQKTDLGKPVTAQDIFTHKKLIQDLNTKAESIQTDMITSATDKGSKAAVKEWFTNGQMQDQTNSTALLVANSISLPNLANDPALESSYQVMLENIASELVDEDVDFTDMTTQERTNLVFQSLIDSGFSGKVSSRDRILKALAKKNSNGLKPFDAYVATRSQEVTAKAMKKLEEAYPEYANYFQRLGEITNYVDRPRIASSLAELSEVMQRKNPNLPDYVLSQALINFSNDIIENNKQTWDSQINPVRGSLMNLMFNSLPSTAASNALQSQLGHATRQAWDALLENRKQERLDEEQGAAPVGSPQYQHNNVFSPVPLPVLTQ